MTHQQKLLAAKILRHAYVAQMDDGDSEEGREDEEILRRMAIKAAQRNLIRICGTWSFPSETSIVEFVKKNFP